MSLVTTDDVNAIMAPGIEDDALQALIDREEAWLARHIGPLAGERTEVLRPPSGDTVLLLRRPTDAVEVVEDGVTLATGFRTGDASVVRDGRAWGRVVEVTYEPSDEAEVRRALFELVRATLSASPNSAESAGGHSVSRTPGLDAWRGQVVRGLRPHRGPWTLRVASR